MWGWGTNTNGQLGIGTTTNVSSPIQVGALTNWKKVFCGQNSSYMIKTDGTLWACGYGFYGQLGQGTNGSGASTSSPVQIGTQNYWLAATTGSANGIWSMIALSSGTGL